MSRQVVLGVDPGFRVTGYALLAREGSSTSVIDIGYLQLSPKKHLSERIGEFYRLFSQKIADHNVTCISLETSFLGKNAQTFLKLGYLRGVLYLLANQHNCQLCEYPPRQVKLATTGYGGASKEQVARVMHQIFPGLSSVKAVAKDDVTDALAISICGLWEQSSSR